MPTTTITTTIAAVEPGTYEVRGQSHWGATEHGCAAERRVLLGYVAKRGSRWAIASRGERRMDGSRPYTSSAKSGGYIVHTDPQVVLDDIRTITYKTRAEAVAALEY